MQHVPAKAVQLLQIYISQFCHFMCWWSFQLIEDSFQGDLVSLDCRYCFALAFSGFCVEQT